MDEPCSALDPRSTAVIEELIGELRRDLAIVIVTHNLQQATASATSVAFMYLGDLVEYGAGRAGLRRAARRSARATTSRGRSGDARAPRSRAARSRRARRCRLRDDAGQERASAPKDAARRARRADGPDDRRRRTPTSRSAADASCTDAERRRGGRASCSNTGARRRRSVPVAIDVSRRQGQDALRQRRARAWSPSLTSLPLLRRGRARRSGSTTRSSAPATPQEASTSKVGARQGDAAPQLPADRARRSVTLGQRQPTAPFVTGVDRQPLARSPQKRLVDLLRRAQGRQGRRRRPRDRREARRPRRRRSPIRFTVYFIGNPKGAKLELLRAPDRPAVGRMARISDVHAPDARRATASRARTCGAPLAADQRYCLDCGARRARGARCRSSTILGAAGAAPAAAARRRRAPPAPRRRRRAAARSPSSPASAACCSRSASAC